MSTQVQTTIAQMLFETGSTLNYARIVAELEGVLRRLKPDQLATTWDCDDLVFFDLAETRIALGFCDLSAGASSTCLTVAVGPRSDAVAADSNFDVLCSRIVERLQARFVPLATLWHQVAGPITAEALDELADSLPGGEALLPPVGGLVGALWDTAAAAEAARAPTRVVGRWAEPEPEGDLNPKPRGLVVPILPEFARAANDAMPAAMPRPVRMRRMQAALAPGAETGDGERMSAQMRLAVHALNATLIFVWMPFGAAVMTYSILKGEDMRLSARLMALTGTFLAFASSPFGHSVVSAVAGTLS
jgi:hypothetical protein